MERTFRIHIAAEMSGVSEGLIRAWERRYGVLKPRRTSSGYRSYTAQDIGILKRLKQLTEEGVAIAEAVKLLPQIRREVKDVGELPAPELKVPRPRQLAEWKTQVLDAAMHGDQAQVEALLDEGLAAMPPWEFFEQLLAPLLVEVGERWLAGTLSVAEEHLVTGPARHRLVALLQQAPRRARAHVLCACFPDEQHEVGLLGAALRFRHAGWRVTWLGQRTPTDQLARVAHTSRVDLVAVSAVVDEGPDAFRAHLAALQRALPAGLAVLVGGRAALQYEALVLEAGYRVARPGDDWAALT